MTKKTTRNNPEKKVIVQSRAYGPHSRAARGSIKPAKLNSVLLANMQSITVINHVASEVHQLLKAAAGSFKESMFWQKLLSKMHQAADTTVAALLSSMEETELNSRYPTDRLVNLPLVACTKKGRQISISVVSNGGPDLKTAGDSYSYELTMLFFSRTGKGLVQEALRSAWFQKQEVAGSISFDFTLPKGAAFYLLCLRVQMGENGRALDFLSCQGMRILKAGKLT